MKETQYKTEPFIGQYKIKTDSLRKIVERQKQCDNCPYRDDCEHVLRPDSRCPDGENLRPALIIALCLIGVGLFWALVFALFSPS